MTMNTKTMQLWDLCRQFIEDNQIDEELINDWQQFREFVSEDDIQDFLVELYNLVKIEEDEDRLPFGMVV